MSGLVAVYNGFFCDSLGSFVYPRSSLAMTYQDEACSLSVKNDDVAICKSCCHSLELNYAEVRLLSCSHSHTLHILPSLTHSRAGLHELGYRSPSFDHFRMQS